MLSDVERLKLRGLLAWLNQAAAWPNSCAVIARELLKSNDGVDEGRLAWGLEEWVRWANANYGAPSRSIIRSLVYATDSLTKEYDRLALENRTLREKFAVPGMDVHDSRWTLKDWYSYTKQRHVPVRVRALVRKAQTLETDRDLARRENKALRAKLSQIESMSRA